MLAAGKEKARADLQDQTRANLNKSETENMNFHTKVNGSDTRLPWSKPTLTEVPAKLYHALRLAAQGYRVFPITPNAKPPALLKEWQSPPPGMKTKYANGGRRGQRPISVAQRTRD
jgi:hypothetical protein